MRRQRHRHEEQHAVIGAVNCLFRAVFFLPNGYISSCDVSSKFMLFKIYGSLTMRNVAFASLKLSTATTRIADVAGQLLWARDGARVEFERRSRTA